ncbi:RDD family protein [Aequorivita echinoideorum]|uniref:RDD family protein n=1 Tax=Aequorivita echinoideorum TaxID=1549647 RepID=A0ABS5S5Z7_9FLAO|nr:RDD family protein [Aequorivita echinoideorum]MBT0608403.1 RDD family protein [Aequorivita echinoideorum]
MANLAINTTQNVNLDYKIVSVGERILAFLIDVFLFSIYFYIVELATAAMNVAFSDNWTVFGIQQLLLLPVMFYSLYMHILFNGRTVGKMAMKTRVVKMDGSPARWSDYLILWMLRLVDIWIFLGSIGLLSIIFSERGQRVGDHAAGTVVISTKNKVSINHTILEEIAEDYQPKFNTVTTLTDKDVRLIKETYLIARKTNDFKTLHMLRKKVETLLGTSSDLYDVQYIDTVLRDYNHFTQNM